MRCWLGSGCPSSVAPTVVLAILMPLEPCLGHEFIAHHIAHAPSRLYVWHSASDHHQHNLSRCWGTGWYHNTPLWTVRVRHDGHNVVEIYSLAGYTSFPSSVSTLLSVFYSARILKMKDSEPSVGASGQLGRPDPDPELSLPCAASRAHVALNNFFYCGVCCSHSPPSTPKRLCGRLIIIIRPPFKTLRISCDCGLPKRRVAVPRDSWGHTARTGELRYWTLHSVNPFHPHRWSFPALATTTARWTRSRS